MELSPSRFFRTGTNELDHGALAKDGEFGSASPSDGNGGRTLVSCRCVASSVELCSASYSCTCVCLF